MLSFFREAPAVAALLLVFVGLGSLFLFLAVQISSIYEEVYKDYATSKAYAEAQESLKNECLALPTIEEALRCFEIAVESARDPQRAEEDLYAQKQMAQWAEWMVYITFLIGVMSVSVAIWGVLLLRKTLDLQRQATEAATQQTRISRQAFVTDQRPWLGVIDAQISKPVKLSDRGNIDFGFVFRIKNFGATPALRVRTEIYISLSHQDLDRDYFALKERGATQVRTREAFVFPDGKLRQSHGTSVPEPRIHTKFEERRRRTGDEDHCITPFLIGHVIYGTSFETTHHTPFYYEIRHRRTGSPVFYLNGDEIPASELYLAPWLWQGTLD